MIAFVTSVKTSVSWNCTIANICDAAVIVACGFSIMVCGQLTCFHILSLIQFYIYLGTNFCIEFLFCLLTCILKHFALDFFRFHICLLKCISCGAFLNHLHIYLNTTIYFPFFECLCGNRSGSSGTLLRLCGYHLIFIQDCWTSWQILQRGWFNNIHGIFWCALQPRSRTQPVDNIERCANLNGIKEVTSTTRCYRNRND